MNKVFLLSLSLSTVIILWHLIFSLFGVAWVVHSSVRGNFLSCHGSFMGKKKKKKKA